VRRFTPGAYPATRVQRVNRPWVPAAALSLTLTLVLSGCSSDSAGEASDGGPAPVASTMPTLEAVTPTPAPSPITASAAAEGEPYEYLGVTVTGGPEQAPVITLGADFAPVTELATGDVWVGEGDSLEPGATVAVQYSGVGQQSRGEFDSSWSRGEPATFSLSQVIQGWQEGMVGMQPGGRRLLVIPSSMAYGPQGSPPVILPDETLAFVVDLIAVDNG
jgi:peptidylprolyl isomerase